MNDRPTVSFKTVRLVETAASLDDPGAALAELEATLGDLSVLGNAALDRGRRRVRDRIAGLYLRAGQLETASDLLLADLSGRASDEADAIIVDPDYTFGGHNHSFDAFYVEAARMAGLAPLVASGPTSLETFAAPVIDLPPMRPRALSPLRFKSQELNALNELYRVVFTYCLPARRPKLVIAPTCFYSFVEGLAGYLSQADGGGLSLIIGAHDTYWADDRPRHDYVKAPYLRALEVLRGIPQFRLLAVAASASIAEGIGRTLACETVVCSHLAPTQSTPRRHAKQPNEAIVVGFVGHTRSERGADLVPEIACLSLARARRPIEWKAQLNRSRLEPSLTPSGREALQSLDGDTRFEGHATDLPSDAYHGLLDAIDLLVVPFTSEYRDRGSGVVTEALRSGMVLVLPEGPLADQAREAGAGFVVFDEHSAGSVASAVLTAIDRYDELRAMSDMAASLDRENPEIGRIREFIVAA